MDQTSSKNVHWFDGALHILAGCVLCSHHDAIGRGFVWEWAQVILKEGEVDGAQGSWAPQSTKSPTYKTLTPHYLMKETARVV